jgi:hypothetical protein
MDPFELVDSDMIPRTPPEIEIWARMIEIDLHCNLDTMQRCALRNELYTAVVKRGLFEHSDHMRPWFAQKSCKF